MASQAGGGKEEGEDVMGSSEEKIKMKKTSVN
jgi:hypothetical protein